MFPFVGGYRAVRTAQLSVDVRPGYAVIRDIPGAWRVKRQQAVLRGSLI